MTINNLRATKRAIFINKDDALNKAILKAEQGQSYVEICKALQIKENYFLQREEEKKETHTMFICIKLILMDLD